MGVQLPSEPITRKEQYLAKAAGQAVEIPAEPITREEAYLEAIANAGGGGGGTTNYNQLSNKPQIAGTTLQGNKTLSDLGIASATALGDVSNAVTAITDGQSINSFADVETALISKQNALTAGDYIQFNGDEISVKRTLDVPLIRYEFVSGVYPNMTLKKYVNEVFDSEATYSFNGTAWNQNIDGFFTLYSERAASWTPIWRIVLIKDSNEPEQEAGYTYEWNVQSTYDFSYTFNSIDVSGKKLVIKEEMDAALANKQDTLTFDDVPTENSNNPVKSGGVKSAIDAAVASAYHHAGTKTCVELVAGLLVAGNEGNVYNMTDSGTTTADFIEGAGQPIKAGDNVGIAKISEGVYKFDLLSGFVDTSNFVQKSVTAGLLKNDGTVDTTIQGDVSTLKSGFTNLDNEVNGDAVEYPYADVITIEDAVPSNLADCNVKIEPVQSGSGDPSPTNIRPITGHTEASVTVVDDAENPTVTKTYTIALGDTIYGGTVDFDSGVMTADRKGVDMGALTWTYHAASGEYTEFFDTNLPNDSIVGDAQITANIISPLYRTIPSHYIAQDGYDNGVQALARETRRLITCDKRYSNAADYTNAVDGNILVYELATPFTVQLTPQQIQLLKGTNTLTASTGQISVTVNGVSGAIGAVQEQVNEIAEDVEDIEDDVTELQGGVTNLNNTNKQSYERIGYTQRTDTENIDILLGDKDLTNYDVVYIVNSYYDQGVATYGSLLVPTKIFMAKYSTDSGIVMLTQDINNNLIPIYCTYDYTTNKISIDVVGIKSKGRYYVVFGAKYRNLV